jgi:hypothetical protein
MKILLVFLLLANAGATFSLEIDEKLTLRFLKVSNSKKTVLINRGAEDGLVLGDHAKFFITNGVVARGVIEKVSPSRSIWSLYRVVDPTEITDGTVLNLKISSPVKITADPSKSMKEEEIPAGSDSMSLTDGDGGNTKKSDSKIEDKDEDKSKVEAKDEGKDEGKNDDKSELDDLNADESPKTKKSENSNGTTAPTKNSSSKNKDKEVSENSDVSVAHVNNYALNWELWTTLAVNSLSGNYEDGSSSGATTTASVASAIDLTGGVEKYFLDSSGIFKEASLLAFVHKRSLETGEDIKISSDWFEFGVGANYHFYHSAASVNKLIGLMGFTVGTGTATIKRVVVSVPEDTYKGKNTFFTGGIGAKYTLSNGFGIRSMLDYYSSSEVYDFGNNVSNKRTLAGPRIVFGFSYRF